MAVLRWMLIGAAFIVLLAVALLGCAWFLFCGWPDQHISRPAFASNVSHLGINEGTDDRQVNTDLTNAFLRDIKPGASIPALVENLDAEGFLTKPEIFTTPVYPSGKCPSSQSRLSVWLQGCKNASADLAKLKTARSGAMWYYWGGLPCTFTIVATWKADTRGKVTGIAMNFDPMKACFD